MAPLAKQPGFRHAVVAAGLVILVSILTNDYKELFISETGHLKVLGGKLGVILSIGLILRWRYIHGILAALSGLGFFLLLGFFLFDFNSSKLLARLCLLTLYGTTTFLLLGSKKLQAYTNSRGRRGHGSPSTSGQGPAAINSQMHTNSKILVDSCIPGFQESSRAKPSLNPQSGFEQKAITFS